MPCPLTSCITLRNLALSVELPTGTGIPDPLKLILPPEDGVASLLSLTLVSIAPSGDPPSAPRMERDSLVGTLSLPRAPPLRPISKQQRQNFNTSTTTAVSTKHETSY